MGQQIRIIVAAVAAVIAMAGLITLQQWVVVPQLGFDSLFGIFVRGLVDWGAWALVTPLIVLAADRAPIFRRGRPQPALLLHAVLGVSATAIWSVPVTLAMMVFAAHGFDGMTPKGFVRTYVGVLQGRSFYYSLFYWLVLGIVTARQLARDAQEEAAAAARLESEALAADLQAARIHYDPRGLAAELHEAAKLAEVDPVRAEERILETAGELQRSLTQNGAAARPRVTAG